MTERSRRVVLLIDYDNLQICAARDTPGRDLQLPPVVQLAQRYGTVILARAYAEWNLSTERLAVYKAGIEPAFAPVLRTESDRSGKSLADTVMVAEGMDMLWTLSPEVVILATSDKDLIPLVRVAKQRGAFVVVLGSDFTAIPLREMADEHVTYRQLITEAGLRYATEAGPGRQPAALPEPSRRRRDRNGRDRSAAVSPGTGTSASPAATPAHPHPEQPAPASGASAAPAPAPSTTAGPSSPAEPVAPVSANAQADADTQSPSRRRRRRGSRRRSDRLGLSTSEYTPSAEEDADAAPTDVEDVAVEQTGEAIAEEYGEPPAGEAPITPTTSAVDVELEPSMAEPTAAADVEPEAAGEAAVAEPAAPPVRERRRRTRRTTTSKAAPEAADEPEQSAAAPSVPDSTEPSVVPEVAEPSAVPEQSADIPPAPPPESTSVNGAAPEAEAAPPARATRPRRVASASRGRSRRP